MGIRKKEDDKSSNIKKFIEEQIEEIIDQALTEGILGIKDSPNREKEIHSQGFLDALNLCLEEIEKKETS